MLRKCTSCANNANVVGVSHDDMIISIAILVVTDDEAMEIWMFYRYVIVYPNIDRCFAPFFFEQIQEIFECSNVAKFV